MRSFLLSVPSKTFLLGEYAVLQGGPALVLTTLPRFELRATQQIPPKIHITGIHLDSPAGQLIQHDAPFYQQYHLAFIDPYEGLGGFGASSAQFVMTAALKQHAAGATLKDNELLDAYKHLAWDGKGIAPSGVDLLAQVHGGVISYDQKNQKKQVKRFAWPFTDLEYGLIHTGNKLATHIHLKQLDHLDTSELAKISYAGSISLAQAHSQNFIKAIQDYAHLLKEKNLVAESTQIILDKLASYPPILAAKGCGALGADVILIIFNKKTKDQTISWLNDNKLNLINYGHHSAEGLEIQEQHEGGKLYARE